METQNLDISFPEDVPSIDTSSVNLETVEVIQMKQCSMPDIPPSSSSSSERLTPNKSVPSEAARKRKRNGIDSTRQLAESIQQVVNKLSQENEEDEDDMFGKVVGAELKKIISGKHKLLLKSQIMVAIAEASEDI